MPTVKILNSNPYNWQGTKCFIDGKEMSKVRSIDFHVAVDEVPTVEIGMLGIPDIEMNTCVMFSFAPKTVTDAVTVLRHELILHGEIYNGFKASLKAAIEKYCTCGLPFEPEEETAGKILDFIIGEE